MSQLVLWGIAFMVAVLAWRDYLKGSVPNWWLWIFLTICYQVFNPVSFKVPCIISSPIQTTLPFVLWWMGLMLGLALTEAGAKIVSKFGVGPADFYVLIGLLLTMPFNVWVVSSLGWAIGTAAVMNKGEKLRALPVLAVSLVGAIILYWFNVI